MTETGKAGQPAEMASAAWKDTPIPGPRGSVRSANGGAGS